jgi:hypothetical protein
VGFLDLPAPRAGATDLHGLCAGQLHRDYPLIGACRTLRARTGSHQLAILPAECPHINDS